MSFEYENANTRKPNTASKSEIQNVGINLEFMLIPLFEKLTGYSEKAIRRKIESGIWIEGIHFRRAPDGRITMNLQEYYQWVKRTA